eukprot:TRINITY_DN9737_c0_g1_i3.p1 TRINITY_DN9737_c0_g1~~TRINITY_DN9737_c0_g1_i3.p1  ORF type:complete len:295 (+),score=62.97 TRINITY_DN9737_c0_g1_i3:153-1037(+)
MLSSAVLGASAGIGAAAGLLIGSIGVGGIVLVPSLIQLPDINVQTAIAACMFSYIFAGLAGGLAYVTTSYVSWYDSGWLMVGAAPGAFAGAFVLSYVSDLVVKAILYTVIVATTGVSLYRAYCDRQSQPSSDERRRLNTSVNDDSDGSVGSAQPDKVECQEPSIPSGLSTRQKLSRFAIGAFVGFGSALTGSSGPVLLIPILLTLHWDIVIALGCAQVIQFPIATAATVSYAVLRPDVLDYALGGCITAGLVPLIFLGAWLASRLPRQTLRLIVLGVLVVASVVLVTQLVLQEA